MTTHDVIGVSLALELERWSCGEETARTQKAPTGVHEQNEQTEDLRLFVEHVARRQSFAGLTGRSCVSAKCSLRGDVDACGGSEFRPFLVTVSGILFLP